MRLGVLMCWFAGVLEGEESDAATADVPKMLYKWRV